MKYGLLLKVLMLHPITMLFVVGLVVSFFLMKKTEMQHRFIGIGAGIVLYFVFGLLLALPKDLVQKEILNGHVSKATYEEAWTEEEERTRQVSCGTDSEGNTKYKTETYYVDVYHPESYYLSTSFGTKSISRGIYCGNLKAFNKTEKFIDVSRYDQVSYGDGNKYEYYFSSGELPFSTYHSYVNFITASETTILKNNSQEILKKYKIPNYPTIYTTEYGNTLIDRVMNYEDAIDGKTESIIENNLNTWSSQMSYTKQCNLFLVLTKKDQNFYNALKVKYKNGNKNDIIVVIGVKDSKVDWINASCYSQDQKFNSNLKTFLNSNIDEEFVNKLTKNVFVYYKRKSMDDYEYLMHNLPINGVVLFILIIVICGSLFAFNYYQD